MALLAAVMSFVSILRLNKAAGPKIVAVPEVAVGPDASLESSPAEGSSGESPSSADSVPVPLDRSNRSTSLPLPPPKKSLGNQVQDEKSYEILAAPYAGALALKLQNGKTIIATVSEVSPFACPAPNRKKMCLLFPSGDKVMVSRELGAHLPRNFKYRLKHY